MITSGGSVTSAASFTVRTGVVLSITIAPPGGHIAINGTAYGASEPIDLYFDTTDVALVVALSSGDFSFGFSIPTSATPGAHYFTAIGRTTHLAVQMTVTVRSDWPQFHGSPLHRGVNPVENVLSPSTIGGADVAWTYTTGGQIAESSPTEANGILYIGSNDNKLYALNPTSGTVLWSYTADGGILGAPAVANGLVYVGTTSGTIFALNATTGTLVWHFATAGSIGSSPTEANGFVYVSSTDNSVYALNATTGALVWRYTGTQLFNSTPTVANGLVFVGSFDDNFYALNATTGAIVWHYTTGGSIIASPANHGLKPMPSAPAPRV